MFLSKKKELTMYVDYSPDSKHTERFGVSKVLFLEIGDIDVEQAIESAYEAGAVTRDSDGDELFWVVVPHNPKRVWDMTERVLRNTMKTI